MSLTYIAGYDGSGASEAAVRLAALLAEAENATLLAAHAHPVVAGPYVTGTLAAADRDLQEDLRRAGHTLLDALDVEGVSRRVLLAGAPAWALHELAVQEHASLIAVGTTHHGRLGRVVPGSVGAKLVSGAPCAVVVVPAGSGSRPVRTIGVAYDGGRESRRALVAAESLATRLGASLVLIGAWDVPLFVGPALATQMDIDPSYRQAFADELDAAAARISSVEVETRLVEGPAGRTIVEASAEGIDLLVAGSRGYGPVRTVLAGGVSRHLVDHAQCPVMVVPRTAGTEPDREPQDATTTAV